MNLTTNFAAPTFTRRIIIIVGAFGSGKSEVAVNLAKYLATTVSETVSIADLDVINPYFRSREAAKELAEFGVRSIIPGGALKDADLPVIVPEIKGAIQSNTGYLILDVGGEDMGATVLRSLHDAFVPGTYELLLTLNANRPFTSTVDGALRIIGDIGVASGLELTGIISNSHFIDDTTPEVVLDGLKLARQVSHASGLPVCFVSVLDRALVGLTADRIGYPVLPINRFLLKPWERKSSTGT
jgi:hypothetical protein